MTSPYDGLAPLDAALAYLAAGFSVVPVKRDGSKAPALGSWKPFQSEPPTPEQARRWWSVPDPPGVALVCGAVSGGLELIDFDREADLIFPRWCALVEEMSPGTLSRVSIVRTPRKPAGYHVWLRCPDMETPGNGKLAELSAQEQAQEAAAAKAEGRKAHTVLIETRGEGGYALAPGCPPECHENHALYEHHAGVPLLQLDCLSIDERDALVACARHFDREIAPEPTPKTAAGNGPDLRPGDDFDRRGPDWSEILAGWVLAGRGEGGERRWRRPGKSHGWSATTGHCSSGGADLLRVFSSNAGPLEEGKAYGKFRAYAALDHGGDLSAAAKALAGRGYGSQSSANGRKASASGTSSSEGAAPAGRQRVPFPPPVPASQLPRVDYADLAVLDGYLYRGRVSLLWSLPKVGKTTLLAGLLRAMGADNLSETFIGRRVRRGKVLYVSEENAGDWGNRVGRWGIRDHVEFLCRPIPATDVHPRLIWADLIEYLAELTRSRLYDLVVIDTIGYAWGVEDENSAPLVQAALNHLTGRFPDSAVLLDHHSRKSGGEEGTGARGSVALLGYCDVNIEVRRTAPQDPSDRRRTLIVNSRIPDAPAETVIEWTEGGEIVAHGTRREEREAWILQEAMERLPADGACPTVKELLENWPSPKPKAFELQKALEQAAAAGRVTIDGSGKRGSPFRYRRQEERTPFDGVPP